MMMNASRTRMAVRGPKSSPGVARPGPRVDSRRSRVVVTGAAQVEQATPAKKQTMYDEVDEDAMLAAQAFRYKPDELIQVHAYAFLVLV